MNIGIFGANSHIAKGLVSSFLKDMKKSGWYLYLFSRKPNLVYHGHSYDQLDEIKLDVIINCVGVGTNPDPSDYFTVTEKYDNLAIEYLKKHPKCLYISFSSGVVHTPLDSDYGVVRLYTERKHRAFKKLNIVDLRLYCYFSSFINLKDDYFMCDIIKAVKKKKTFSVGKQNFIRDYIHPKDLFQLIQKIIKVGKVNDAFEVYSKSPVTKQEIVNHFFNEYKLTFKLVDEPKSATGQKGVYCPKRGLKLAKLYNYEPKYTSYDTIVKESKCLLKDEN